MRRRSPGTRAAAPAAGVGPEDIGGGVVRADIADHDGVDDHDRFAGHVAGFVFGAAFRFGNLARQPLGRFASFGFEFAGDLVGILLRLADLLG